MPSVTADIAGSLSLLANALTVYLYRLAAKRADLMVPQLVSQHFDQKMREELSDVKFKANLLYDLFIERGMGQLLRQRLLKSESPLQLAVHLVNKHRDLLDRVDTWYRDEGAAKYDSRDIELMLELGRAFRVDIEQLAMQEQLDPSAALLAVAFHVNPKMEIFRRYNTKEWE